MRGSPIFPQLPSEPIPQVDGAHTYTRLHESTSPEEIARVQRKDIRAAIRVVGRELPALSAAVDLDEWVLRRRLAEIYDEPLPETRITGRLLPRIVEVLKDSPGMTAAEIGRKTGNSGASVAWWLSKHTDVFAHGGSAGKWGAKIWRLK